MATTSRRSTAGVGTTTAVRQKGLGPASGTVSASEGGGATGMAANAKLSGRTIRPASDGQGRCRA